MGKDFKDGVLWEGVVALMWASLLRSSSSFPRTRALQRAERPSRGAGGILPILFNPSHPSSKAGAPRRGAVGDWCGLGRFGHARSSKTTMGRPSTR